MQARTDFFSQTVSSDNPSFILKEMHRAATIGVGDSITNKLPHESDSSYSKTSKLKKSTGLKGRKASKIVEAQID